MLRICVAVMCGLLPIVSVSPLHAQNSGTLDDLDQLLGQFEDASTFNALIAKSTVESPIIAQRRANRAEAAAAKREARSALFPTIDLAVSANRALAREFSNDPDNVIERARGAGRADMSAGLTQTLIDFGAANRRIAAATSRIEAAQADIDTAYEDVALRAIGAWIDLVAYQQLTDLSDAHVVAQTGYRAMLQTRIDQGISASIDNARLDAAIAVSQQRAARFRQELGNAQARFRDSFGAQFAIPTQRPPLLQERNIYQDDLIVASQNLTVVRSAKAQARGAQEEARAARSDMLPNISVGIDAGRFGIFEQDRNDYDVRARISLRYRLFGPANARADQAAARASAALSRSDAVFRDAEREVRIAISDVASLASSSAANQADYAASRRTRDAEIARFRIARGTMFDVLVAQDRYFNSAVNYLRSISESDAARYVLLARSGQLLSHLGITPDYSWQSNR